MTDEQKEQLEHHLQSWRRRPGGDHPGGTGPGDRFRPFTHSNEVVLLQMDEETVAGLDEVAGSAEG